MGLYKLFPSKLLGLILICIMPTNPQKFCLLLGGVYSNAENQNLAYHINIKCEEKSTQQQTKGNAEYRFVTSKLVMFVFSTLMLSSTPLCILKEMTLLYQ